jgi:hypothetical protein
MLTQATSSAELTARRHATAWYAVVGTLALHVLDEATTGFLDFYNPLVARAREQWPWFPMPPFSFFPWLAGLVLLVMALGLLGPLVQRGRRGTRALSWAVSLIMMANGAGHLLGSIYFGRWLPGATSAPLLFLAALFLAVSIFRRGHAGEPSAPGPAA